MGGSVIMQLKAGGARKLKRHLQKRGVRVVDGVFLVAGPGCAHKRGYAPDCWITFQPGDMVDVGYSSGYGNDDWAQAIAISIYKRFPIEKGGWDSVGFCKKLEDFKNSVPFGVELRRAERYANEYSMAMPRHGITQAQLDNAREIHDREANALKSHSKEYLKAAEAVLGDH